MKHHIIEQTGSIIPEPECYSDCITLFKSDAYRHRGRNKSLLALIFASLTSPSLALSFWFRLSQYRGIAYPITRIMLSRFKRCRGIFLSPQIKIGYGFYVQHCFGIIINKSAIIGNNVNIGQLTTIGSNVERAAIIGDNVYLGPNSCIVDDIIISQGACVGAGAVVTRNIESNITVAGVPAREISKDGHPEYIRNPWPIKLR